MAIWHKLPHETAKQYSAFQKYMLLAVHERSIKRAFEDERVEHPSKSKRAVGKGLPSLWNQWSRMFNWVERANAYDTHMFSIQQVVRERAVQAQAAEHSVKMMGISQQVLDKVQEMLKMPITRQKIHKDGQTIIIEPVRWGMGDIGFLLQTADRLTRLSLGMETERKVLRVDVNSLTDEQLERLGHGEEFEDVVIDVTPTKSGV